MLKDDIIEYIDRLIREYNELSRYRSLCIALAEDNYEENKLKAEMLGNTINDLCEIVGEPWPKLTDAYEKVEYKLMNCIKACQEGYHEDPNDNKMEG